MDSELFVGDRATFRRSATLCFGASTVLLVLSVMLMLLAPAWFLLALFGLGVATVLLYVGFAVLPAVSAPPTLQVDGDGLSATARGRSVRLLWSQVDEVRIIQRSRPDRRRVWLMVWLRSGVPVPKHRLYLPQWMPELAGVQFSDLTYFPGQEAAIERALARFAGDRWNATPTGR